MKNIEKYVLADFKEREKTLTEQFIKRESKSVKETLCPMLDPYPNINSPWESIMKYKCVFDDEKERFTSIEFWHKRIEYKIEL